MLVFVASAAETVLKHETKGATSTGGISIHNYYSIIIIWYCHVVI